MDRHNRYQVFLASMNIIKPLQLMARQTVLEQDNRFHLVVTASIGFRLDSGSVLLEPDAMKESIAAMGSNPIPDAGMPKPKAEYLVSGSFYSPQGEAVGGGEVKVQFGSQQKSLYVFGDRSWQMGIPSGPESITQMPLDYAHAFGGNGYDDNPVGIGYQQEQLPNIENPDDLLISPTAKIQPAGLTALDQVAAQKRQYQGTYDESYLEKYYPGYPADFDWHYFMCSARDQWSEQYYAGNEPYSIENMHPHKPLISGKLPGYKPRAFLKKHDKTDLLEVELNLDTVWLFPEEDLGLLIWRGGLNVEDDEASEMIDLMLAYENSKDQARDKHYYETAYANLTVRKNDMLDQLGSELLIPVGDQCAMQILQDKALQDSKDSEFGKNLIAKAASAKALVTAQLDEALKDINTSLPENTPAESSEMLDIEKLLKESPELKEDAEVVEFKKKLEKILPGITAGDPKKIQLKGFNFEKIDEIMKELDRFMAGKQALAQQQIKKIDQDLRNNIESQIQTTSEGSAIKGNGLEEVLSQLDNLDNPPAAPLPRIDSNAILGELDQLSSSNIEALQNLQNMKSMGADEETIRQLETFIAQSTGEKDLIAKARMQEVERDFKETYLQIAHHQDNGVAPHKNSLAERRQEFLDAFESGHSVRGQDWSGIDLSGLNLDGIDLSEAYLEQVDLSGCSLLNANFEEAILARAILDRADFTASNFKNANIGAVSAKGSKFNRCDLSNAKLSKGDFENASFVEADLTDIESLEISFNFADFTSANMPALQLIEISSQGTNFSRANLQKATFLQSLFSNIVFSDARLDVSTWADCHITESSFDRAEMTAACFATTDPEVIKIEQCSFREAILDRANFQSMDMQRSNLASSSLVGANFSEANLYGSVLDQAKATGCLFRKANLRNSTMENIDLREGSLAKSFISGANLTGANLYAVDFLRATHGETELAGCNLDNTLLQNWRPSR